MTALRPLRAAESFEAEGEMAPRDGAVRLAGVNVFPWGRSDLGIVAVASCAVAASQMNVLVSVDRVMSPIYVRHGSGSARRLGMWHDGRWAAKY